MAHQLTQKTSATCGPSDCYPCASSEQATLLALCKNKADRVESRTKVDSAAALGAVESSMTHISGHHRSQMLLLPEAVDDYVGADNPVRFIDAFVDELDLSAAGVVRVTAKATGRPGYAPADLLKLYIYGYLNRVRSSRRLEIESHRNIEVIWLLRSLKPDFKTIADFRRVNRAAFRSVFREFTTSTDASCWPWTEPGSRRSTTRIATSRGTRCKISSARPTSVWTTICGVWTKAISRKAERAAARARNTWPRRSRRSAKNGGATGRCWGILNEPARTKYR